MRVFVYEAFMPAGGTFMAYHIGRILREHFGLEVLAVGTRPAAGMFRYPVSLPVVDHAHLLAAAAPDDLLICNPSFSDSLFGLRLPCRKLSYVQNVRTFRVLDVFFDRYVFVSEWVRRFVNLYYGIDGPVIPAFIDTDTFHAGGAEPAVRRRRICAVMERKHDPLVFERLSRAYERLSGGEPLPVEMVPRASQAELATRFRGARVFLGLDVMEGFGLPMLEAMACGCATVGWDSGGCHEYARPGRNVLLARYGDIDLLAGLLRTALTDDEAAGSLGAEGAATAPDFCPERFDRAWISVLEPLVHRR